MSYVPTREDLSNKLTDFIEQADDLYRTAIDARDNTDFTNEEAIALSMCASEAMKISVMMTVFRKRICDNKQTGKERKGEDGCPRTN